MKRINLLIVILALGLFSCEKDQTLTPNPEFLSNQTPSLVANIGETNFVASTMTAVFTNGVLNVTATNNAGFVIVLSVNGSNQQSYSIESNATNFITYSESNEAADVFSSITRSGEPGRIQLTEINKETKKVSGLFDGVVYKNPASPTDSLLVQTGKFEYINYTGTLN